MKVRNIPAIVVVLAMLVIPCAALAQRSGFIAGVAQPPHHVQHNVQPGPQSTFNQPFGRGAIYPMTNPILPFVTTPVPPMVPQPVIHYPYTTIPYSTYPYGTYSYGNGVYPTVNVSPTPTVVGPSQPQTYYGRPERNVTVVAPGATIVGPGATVITQPPNEFPRRSRPNDAPDPDTLNAQPQGSSFNYNAPPPAAQRPEPVIVQPQSRRRPLPAGLTIGTPRTDVMQWFGNPIGTAISRGTETLYFEGGPVVVIQDGRVVEYK